MATIAEKSRSKEIIDRLQAILNNASPVPLASGKVSIYKDEVQSLLDELAMQMDAEIKTYHEVNDRRGKLITEAKKEAERIIAEAEHTASRMRVTKRSTNVAALDHTDLTDEEIYSLTEANEIYAASLIYTDEMLTEVSKMIEDAYHNIRSDYEVVMQVMEDKLNTIVNNKNELMSGLQELDGKDRSQQIMEIGHLLSEELYNERMKKRMNSDEYDDGSVQLSLDLQMEQAEENARQAEAYAREAVQALEQVTAERDALMKTVQEMENAQKEEAKQDNKVSADKKTDDEDSEFVYISEDELEEDDEYEIEYVDEEEYEKLVAEGKIDLETGMLKEDVEDVAEKDVKPEDKKESSETVKAEESDSKKEESASKDSVKDEPKKESESKKEAPEKTKEEKETKVAAQEKKNESIPGIVDVSVESKDDDIANAKTVKLDTDGVKRAAEMAKHAKERKNGLIGRAVANRELEEAGITIEPIDPVAAKETDAPKEVIKTDKQGNQYVQATMQFDENFEITEF